MERWKSTRRMKGLRFIGRIEFDVFYSSAIYCFPCTVPRKRRVDRCSTGHLLIAVVHDFVSRRKQKHIPTFPACRTGPPGSPLRGAVPLPIWHTIRRANWTFIMQIYASIVESLARISCSRGEEVCGYVKRVWQWALKREVLWKKER